MSHIEMTSAKIIVLKIPSANVKNVANKTVDLLM